VDGGGRRHRGREQKHRAQEKGAVHHRGRGWKGRGVRRFVDDIYEQRSPGVVDKQGKACFVDVETSLDLRLSEAAGGLTRRV
jgi:hypothetical protein